jgi:DNA repair exonuclease SbcCD nuclease subunit
MLKGKSFSDNRVAIFTDLHLGVHQNSSSWHDIGKKWADWFISSLKENNIKTILFTGDFFHSRSEISVNTIYAASELLKKFEKDFFMIMIPGNHDCYYKDKSDVNSLSILNGYDNIVVLEELEKITFGDKKRDAIFCPWGFDCDSVEHADVIFGHFEIESFKMNAHKLCEHGFKPKDLLKKSPLVFSGHFHLNEERSYDNGKIVYVGSPFQLDFGERDSRKGYYILDFTDMNFEFIENNITPVHKKILLTEINDVDLESSVKGNFVKIVIDRVIEQEELDKIIHKINSYSPNNLIIDPLINYSIGFNGDGNEDLSGVDISKAIVEFVNLLDIQDKEKVITKTIEFYNQVK